MLAMLVDDSRSSLLHLKQLLESDGDLDCHAFADPYLALDKAGRHRFDVVVVNHIMPMMDGIAFTRRLRDMAIYAQVPIVMLTAGSSRSVRLAALEAAEIAGHHHEPRDGRGYPRKISGTDIPLSARIVAVTDVFDAMTTDRPYKAAMPVAMAPGCIAEERGQHFDPDCVDAFLAAYTRLHSSAQSAGQGQDAEASVETLRPGFADAVAPPSRVVAFQRAANG